MVERGASRERASGWAAFLPGYRGSDSGREGTPGLVGHAAAELIGGPTPDREPGRWIVGMARDHVPVNVRDLVPQALVVDAEGAEHLADRARGPRDIFEQSRLARDGQFGQVLMMI